MIDQVLSSSTSILSLDSPLPPFDLVDRCRTELLSLVSIFLGVVMSTETAVSGVTGEVGPGATPIESEPLAE